MLIMFNSLNKKIRKLILPLTYILFLSLLMACHRDRCPCHLQKQGIDNIFVGKKFANSISSFLTLKKF